MRGPEKVRAEFSRGGKRERGDRPCPRHRLLLRQPLGQRHADYCLSQRCVALVTFHGTIDANYPDRHYVQGGRNHRKENRVGSTPPGSTGSRLNTARPNAPIMPS